MPLPPDLDPEADQAVRGLLRLQPGLTMPETVRSRLLTALAEEAATRAALYDNDSDPTVAVQPLDKSVQHRPSHALPTSSPGSPSNS